MAKGEELIRYITEQVVTYMDTPKEQKLEQRYKKEPWQIRWFGMLPLTFKMMLGRNSKKDETPSKH